LPFLRKYHRKLRLIIRPHTNYSNNKYNCISKKNNPSPFSTPPKQTGNLFRHIIEANTTLNTKFKEPSHLENDYKHFIALLQAAAKMATPTSHHNNTHNDIPLRIKKLLRKEEQDPPAKTHSPENKLKFNQLSNILKHQLQDLRNVSFEK
jgi:hypothetical protein